jgi:hypothetical protein
MDFKLPLKELKPDDYGPIQLIGFKDYYKSFFKELIKKVRYIFIIILSK